jgi:DUF2946 family protein
MSGLRRHKRVVGWLAAIALLGNVLAIAPFIRPSTVTVLDDILGPIVICTADGAKALSDQGSGSGDHQPCSHCPACVMLAQFALAVAVVLAAIAFPLPPTSTRVPLRARPLAFHLCRGAMRSRAPPLSA